MRVFLLLFSCFETWAGALKFARFGVEQECMIVCTCCLILLL